MQPDQPHSATAPPLVPGFIGGGEQILFIQTRPDVFLSGQLEIIEFQLYPLTSNQKVGLTFSTRRSSS